MPAPPQHFRCYATGPEKKGGSNNTLLYAAGAAVALGGAGYYFLAGTPAAKKAEAEVQEAVLGGAAAAAAAKKAFTGGEQGFISLKLEDVETVNHNTKRLRFKLPEDDMVSGLEVASALLTKFKPTEADKPVIRPYTPISDEGADCCSSLPRAEKAWRSVIL